MRGRRDQQTTMLAFVDLEERVPRKHPLRVVKQFADRALRELSPVFDQMYAAGGRRSIPPERLLKASLLIALYSIRSETAFCEELDYQLLYRWFLDMGMLEPSFDPTVFTKNRRRLLKHDVAQRFFDEVVRQAAGLGLLSDQHFTVDGTLIEAAASLKSFRAKDKPPTDPPPDDPGNPTVNFHGQRRSNTTHQSTTDPEALLAKKGKGKEARLSFMGHALMKSRNGLVVDFQLSQATGTAERDMAPKLVDQARERGFHPRTLAADKSYDTTSRRANVNEPCGGSSRLSRRSASRAVQRCGRSLPNRPLPYPGHRPTTTPGGTAPHVARGGRPTNSSLIDTVRHDASTRTLPLRGCHPA
jgi:transposase